MQKSPNAETNSINVSGQARFESHVTQVGSGSRASIVKSAGAAAPRAQEWSAISAQLDKLVAALATSEIPTRMALVKATADVATEAKKPEPNANSALGVLNGVADGVKSVSAIAGAVEAIKSAILALV